MIYSKKKEQLQNEIYISRKITKMDPFPRDKYKNYVKKNRIPH